MRELDQNSDRLTKTLKSLSEEFKDLMYQIPNLPQDDVPVGKDERENVVLNLPVLDNISGTPSISLFVNGEPMIIQNNIKIRTQYGWCSIFQSKISNAQEWVLKIE